MQLLMILLKRLPTGQYRLTGIHQPLFLQIKPVKLLFHLRRQGKLLPMFLIDLFPNVSELILEVFFHVLCIQGESLIVE